MNQSVWRRPRNSDPPTSERAFQPVPSSSEGCSGHHALPPWLSSPTFNRVRSVTASVSGCPAKPGSLLLLRGGYTFCSTAERKAAGTSWSSLPGHVLRALGGWVGGDWVAHCLCVCRGSSSWERRRLELLSQASTLCFLGLSTEQGSVTWLCCSGAAPCLHTHLFSEAVLLFRCRQAKASFLAYIYIYIYIYIKFLFF